MKKNWAVKQLDVNNAFLQGDLTEEVYMSQPPGFIDQNKPHYIYKLNKPIYGLKQAPRTWYQSLKTHLFNGGFINSAADTSLFIRRAGPILTYVLVYVDNILVTGNDQRVIAMVLQSLADRFSIKDPTDLHYFLGIEATRIPQGLHLMQRRYIQDLLAKNNMLDAKKVATPLPSSPKLTQSTGTPLSDATQYRSVVGSLQYLAFTRPDITYAVNRLSQFMHKPTDEHWQGAKHVLRYLADTPSHGIFLKAASPMTLHGFFTLTGPGTLTTTSPPMPMYCTLAVTLSLGLRRNKKGWLGPRQRQNIVLLLTSPLRSPGSHRSSLNLASNHQRFQLSIVIILAQHIYVLIPCFILG